MIELIVLAIAVTGIASLARGRGKSPVAAGTIAVVGHLLILYGGSVFVRSGDGQLLLLIAAWIWVALVAGFLRFVVGAGRPKPDGKWSCANCTYLNNSSSIICEACQQPWKPA